VFDPSGAPTIHGRRRNVSPPLDGTPRAPASRLRGAACRGTLWDVAIVDGGRVFLLSPASTSGVRAQLLFREGARFDLARRLRTSDGAPLGEVFSFVSGLYFRGKLEYARRFAAPPERLLPLSKDGVLVITPGAGLRAPDTPLTLRELRQFAQVVIAHDNPGYCRPLLADARAMARRLPAGCEVVLLGSIASSRYLDVLASVFGGRLRFPAAFVGRGDMSRGGLMLRCVADGQELTYAPFGDTGRHGPRPPKLVPRPRTARTRSDA